MPYRKSLCARLSMPVSKAVAALTREEAALLEEIRVRCMCRMELVIGEERRVVPYIPDDEGMGELIAALCGYAVYAKERQLTQGFLTLPGGHRAGVCGRMTLDEGSCAHMTEITSVCIRIARHVEGASIPIRPFLCDAQGRPRRVLLLGAPGCGKTTALRDAAIWLARERGLHVAVSDEREELFPTGSELGAPVDVLRGMGKAQGMRLLLRAMSPQVLVTDEIGAKEDAQAIEEAARCGVGLLVSAHGSSLEEAMGRPTLHELMQCGGFDCCIVIGRHGVCLDAWDVERAGRGCFNGDGHRGDGADWGKRHWFFDSGWGKGPCALHSRDAAQSASYARTDPL